MAKGEGRDWRADVTARLERIEKLLSAWVETMEIITDPEQLKAIVQGLQDIKAGRVFDARKLFEGNEESKSNG